MRRRSLRHLALALAGLVGTAAAAVFGLPAPAAIAAPLAGNVIVQFAGEGSFPVDGRVFTVTGRCPSGYRLVGSGAETTSELTMITALAPTVDFTGATLAAFATQPTADTPSFADIYVVCAPATQFADVTVVRTVDHAVRPGAFVQGIGRCPAGQYAFGGGGFFQKGGSGFLGAARDNATNAPSADGSAWTFAGVAPPGATSLEVDIQCAPRTGHDFLMQFGNVSTSGGPTTSFATCPAGYTPIAGGFYASNSDGSVAIPTSVSVSRPEWGSWRAQGISPLGTKMVALAQCLF